MIVLSFDIGIKNLAYSLVTIDKGRLVKVHDWGIINLLEHQTGSTLNTCVALTRTSSDDNKVFIKCDNKASQSIGKSNKKLLVCKNKKCEAWVLKEWKLLYPKSKAKLGSFKAKKATSYSLIDMATAMKRWIEHILSSDWNTMTIDVVLLEHLPVFRNPVMKSVLMILVGILVGTGFHTNIHFVHASKKTKDMNSYAARKHTSILMITELKELEPNIFTEKVWNIWLQSRKRDDLADTVNLASAWCVTHDKT